MANRESSSTYTIDAIKARLHLDRAEMYNHMPSENTLSTLFIAGFILLQVFQFKDTASIKIACCLATLFNAFPFFYAAKRLFYTSWIETRNTGWRSYFFNVGFMLGLVQLFIIPEFANIIKAGISPKSAGITKVDTKFTFGTAGIIVAVTRILRVGYQLMYCRMKGEDSRRFKYICFAVSPIFLAYVLCVKDIFFLPEAVVLSALLLSAVEESMGKISEKPMIDGTEVIPGAVGFLLVAIVTTMIVDDKQEFTGWIKKGHTMLLSG